MTRRFAVAAVLAVFCACSAALIPALGDAATRTQTLRFYDKPVSIRLTHADGTIARGPQPPVPGDTLDVYSLDYRGNHAHHSRRFVASTHLRCTFGTGAPACESHVAIGGSMLIFTGNPGKVSGGTGIYRRATGRVISSKEVAGQDNASDVVARIRLR